MNFSLYHQKLKFTCVKKILPFLILLFLTTKLTKAQCPVAAPTGIGNCTYNNNNILLSANGSTGFYNWYQNAVGGPLLESGSTFVTPEITASTNYYVSASDTNAALAFDGVNDYVAINHSYSVAASLSQFTLEAWVNTSYIGASMSDNWSIIDFDRSEYYNLFIRGDNGEVGFSTTAAGVIDDFYTAGNTVNDGLWHHIVAVFDGVDKIIYVDGIEVARKVNPHGGVNIGSGLTRFGFLGDGSEANAYNAVRNNFYYNGKIDEVRIWNDVRTPLEITTFKDSCLNGNEAGLIIYYNMNEFQGTTITDITGGGATGTLFNFNLANAWVNGVVNNCDCESARIPVAATLSNNNLSDLKLTCGPDTLDAGAGFASYLWNTGETTQKIAPPANGFYQVTTTGACAGSDNVSVVGQSDAINSLIFDGTNDYAAIQNMNYLGTYTELTVEAWIKTSNGADQVIASFDRSEFWRLEINGNGGGTGQIGFDINTNAGILDFGSTTRVDDGEWHHIAATYNNGVANIYIDGILDATTTLGISFGSTLIRYGFLGIGSESNTYNGTTGPNSYFDGEIDEFRIWNKAKTITEIRDDMSAHIPGNDTDLNLYYKFDEISASTIYDYSTINRNNCLLYNFGASPLITSSAYIGDEATYLYTNSWAGQNVSINSCDGETFTASNVAGTPEGVFVYFVNSVPNSVTGIAGLGPNDRYFGVHKINDLAATYTGTYNYTGNPHVSPASEPTVAVFRRANNAVTTWIDAAGTLDIVSNTVVATAQGTQFIIGSNGVPLPISLLNFTAQLNDNNIVDIKWQTTTEINNDYFTLEKSNDGLTWFPFSKQPGAGNSSQLISYNDVDEFPYQGVSYYRLKQTDFDYDFEYSKIISVTNSHKNPTVAYPNPVKNILTLTNITTQHFIKVYAANGQLVYNGNTKTIDTEKWSLGLYQIVISDTNGNLIQKIKIVK